MRSAAKVALLAAFAACAALAACAVGIGDAEGGSRTPVPLGASVLLLGSFDWETYQAQPPFTSRCE